MMTQMQAHSAQLWELPLVLMYRLTMRVLLPLLVSLPLPIKSFILRVAIRTQSRTLRHLVGVWLMTLMLQRDVPHSALLSGQTYRRTMRNSRHLPV